MATSCGMRHLRRYSPTILISVFRFHKSPCTMRVSSGPQNECIESRSRSPHNMSAVHSGRAGGISDFDLNANTQIRIRFNEVPFLPTATTVSCLASPVQLLSVQCLQSHPSDLALMVPTIASPSPAKPSSLRWYPTKQHREASCHLLPRP